MKLSLETTSGPSRVLWFVFGAVSGTLATGAIVAQTVWLLVKQGVIK